MGVVTRHALRVYAALASLRREGDVIDALIPFLEPILELMHGKVYDPDLVALGVQRLYGWRFNRDVAEQFAGRLLSKRYLKRPAPNVLVVDFKPVEQRPDGHVEMSEVLERIVDEFEAFPPKVTDLFQFKLTRDQLKEILIRFVVSLNAYTEEAFAEQMERLALDIERQSLLDQLEEGGQPLTKEERYLCARFVRHLAKERAEFVPHLARLASIGLLAEVVEDFIKPTTPATRSDLTVILDAPVALNLLGTSGTAAQQDIRNVVDSLRAIGCTFIVFPVSCEEMSRNLSSMLKLGAADRHGPTHDAMRKGEVAEDFVRSVMNDPERALVKAGVTVRQIDLDNFPGSARYFPAEQHEDFMAGITWKHGSIDAREHDATCATLTMRLRAGNKSSDPLGSKFVFVTTNARFVRYARDFCLRARMINERQTPPVMLQRELATNAWLRTGLSGTAGTEAPADIPRSHLIASCERVLRSRREVTQAVHQKLREFAPERIEQYELLLADQRSVQRLMDETLGDERLVTAENAEKLLEEMRRATAEEVEEEWKLKFKRQAQRLGAENKVEREAAAAALRAKQEEGAVALRAKEEEVARRDAELAALADDRARLGRELEAARSRDVTKIEGLIERVNRMSRRVERTVLVALWIVVLASFYGTTLGQRPNDPILWWVGIPLALLATYHFVQEIRQKPVLGLKNLLNAVARWRLARGLRAMGMDQAIYREEIEVDYGRLLWKKPALEAGATEGGAASPHAKDEAA